MDTRIAAMIGAIALFGSEIIRAEEISLPDFGFSIEMPHGWNSREVSRPDHALDAVSQDGQTTISVWGRQKTGKSQHSAASVISKMRENAVTKGELVGPQGETTVGGQKFVSFSKRETGADPEKTSIVLVCETDEAVLVLIASNATAPEVEKAIGSFRLLSPSVPSRTESKAALPRSYTQEFPEYNFSVSLPPGWVEILAPEPDTVMFQSKENESLVTICVVETADIRESDVREGLIAALANSRRKLSEQGGKLDGEKEIVINGLRFIAVEAHAPNMERMLLVTRKGPRLYLIACLKDIGNHDEDTTQSIVESFRILNPNLSEKSITASQLYNAYQSNSIAADQKYKGYRYVVSGVVESVGKSIWGTPYVALKTSNMFSTVQCFFTENDINRLTTIAKGQVVSISGVVESGAFGGIVGDCEFR